MLAGLCLGYHGPPDLTKATHPLLPPCNPPPRAVLTSLPLLILSAWYAARTRVYPDPSWLREVAWTYHSRDHLHLRDVRRTYPRLSSLLGPVLEGKATLVVLVTASPRGEE